MCFQNDRPMVNLTEITTQSGNAVFAKRNTQFNHNISLTAQNMLLKMMNLPESSMNATWVNNCVFVLTRTGVAIPDLFKRGQGHR